RRCAARLARRGRGRRALPRRHDPRPGLRGRRHAAAHRGGVRPHPTTAERHNHMALDELAEAAASLGGKWVKLQKKADGAIEGKVVAFEKRNRTDPDGNVVYKRGTQTPRIEWLFTLEVDPELREGPDDDGIRKLAANESMQWAIAAAIKEAGGTPNIGDR